MVYGRGMREDGDGTVFDLFIGKMDQEIAVFWSKNGSFGTVLHFFSNNYDNFY